MPYKLLFVVPYVPNLVRVRPYNILRALAARGNQITLFTISSDPSENEAISELRSLGIDVHVFNLPKSRSFMNCAFALPSRIPLQAVYCWNPRLAFELQKQFNHGNNQYDIVHIEHLRGVRYGLALKEYFSSKTGSENGTRRPPIVWDSVDSISHLFRQAAKHSRKRLNRMLLRFELSRTEKFEGFLVSQFDHTLVTSRIDKKSFLALANNLSIKPKEISVVPNGVDLDYFGTRDEIFRESETIVISGKLSYHANASMVHYLVQQIMPLVWSEHPNVKLFIVGKDPSPEISAYQENPNITVTGTVEDIRPYLQRAAISVSPILYGAGIQNKVLEAMASCTPVVATPQAVSAIHTEPGRDVLIAENPTDFAQQINTLLENPELREYVAKNGRQYVEKNHHWERTAEKIEGIYAEVISRQWPSFE